MAVNASFDAQFLNIPIRSLFINGDVFPVVIREVTIDRGQGVHDSVSMSVLIPGEMTFSGDIRVPYDDPTSISRTKDISVSSLTGQAINFTFGISPNVEQFFGYVTSITPDQQFKQGLNYIIQMVGSTLITQILNRRFYTNVTASQVAKRCTDRARLGYQGISTPYIWPAIGVTNDTDWTVLNAMASVSGAILLNWAGVVRMVDPLELFREYPFTTLIQSDEILESDRKLMDFKPTEHTIRQVSKAPQQFYFFDANGGVVSYVQPTNSKADPVPWFKSPVRNREEAEVYGNASVRTLSRWLQDASARIKGDASIYPGVTVDVNTGTRSSSAKFNGRWLVTHVKHSMKRDAYATELTLTRPGGSIPALTKSSFQHFWRNSPKARPALSLRNGQWVSSWSEPFVEVTV